MRTLVPLAIVLLLVTPMVVMAAPLEMSEPVVLRAAAVSETPNGLVGSTASITITTATGGSGHIFLDTFPLAEVDIQGSARLAVRVASQITGISWRDHDFFFVIRSGSQMIGGPSAGASLTVGAIAALSGWHVREDVLMTGTINPDGSVGPVGGVPEKAGAAKAVGMHRFLFPAGQAVVTFQGETIDLVKYCAEKLDIECVPVRDVIDAVNHMTDHIIERPPVPTNVTDEAYRALLDPLSLELRSNASRLAEEAASAVDALDPANRSVWLARVEGARNLVARAESAAANGTYYTSASLSFQASIEGHAVRDSARLIAAADPRAEFERILNASRLDVRGAATLIEKARTTNVMHFETVGAAQMRLQEAEVRFARAELPLTTQTDGPGLLTAVYDAAYSAERAHTATWWIRLGEHLEPGDPVSENDLKEAARETITAAKEAVAYIDAVLRQQFQGDFLSAANALMTSAENAATRGFHAAAILQAIEAEVRASMVLEVASYRGDIPPSKFNASREEAARAIEAARGRGVEPLLAQSQYEFGLTLEDPFDRLAFLGIARVTANLAGLPGVLGSSMPAESRFQKLPATIGAPPSWVPAAFALGLALGVGAGLTALIPKDEDEKEKAANKRARAPDAANASVGEERE